MKVFIVDPPLFTLPYDVHFARALAGTLDSWPDFARECIGFYAQRLAERRTDKTL